MIQTALFGSARPKLDAMALRPYQRDAVAGIDREWYENANRSTLVVMATGLGKTRLATEVIRREMGRVIFMAHRDELLEQARRRIEHDTGELVEMEKAELRAGSARIVVASVQTLCQPRRLEQFNPAGFGLLIVDEVHHATSATYRRILDHFPAAKVLGLTATPDRADEAALGQIMDSVAYVYEIQDGIRDGWLCPLTIATINIQSIELANIKTVAGDYDQGALEAAMASEKVMHGMAKAIIEQAGDRRTLIFYTGVANCHRFAEILNRPAYKPGSARAVDGKTELLARRRLLKEHQGGEYQFLVNHGITGEGYDDPGIQCVVPRLTKSRSAFTQFIGRGLRIHPGKQDCLIIEFHGHKDLNGPKTTLDILGGKYGEEDVAKARKLTEDRPGIRADEALRLAEEDRLAVERRKNIAATKVKYTATAVDPFALFQIPATPAWGSRFAGAASVAQVEALKRWKIDMPPDITKAQAHALLGAAIKRKGEGLASYAMIRALGKRGINAQRMANGTAKRLMAAIEANGWRNLPPEQVQEIVSRGREPGEDG